MDFPLGPAGTLNVSLLERYDSGTPYSLSFSAARQADPNAPVLGNPNGNPNNKFGYWQAPTTVTYFLDKRGSERWDDVTATDVALNYRLPISVVQLFVEGEIINAFNEQAQILGSTAITRAAAFNPFTQTPVEGVNYNKAANFGQARSSADYQQARTYRVSVGFRF